MSHHYTPHPRKSAVPIFILRSQARAQYGRRRGIGRVFSLILAAVLLLFVLWPTSTTPSTDDSPNLENARDKFLIHPSKIGRVFIAANHYNSDHLLESHWIPALVSLIQYLGKENVFVSIAASRGRDDTLPLLWDFNKRLEEMGVERRILLDEETHESVVEKGPAEGEQGWVITPKGEKMVRRIPYLAKVRNRLLEPLKDVRVVNATRGFDKVLFLNDIIFTSQDALTLLNTRDGNYAAACGLDFLPNGMFYDTFVMRDSLGRMVVDQSKYPYFGSGPTRDALLRGHPMPVASCWNGIAAFDAKPFLDPVKPLRFRAIEDSLANEHVEASECCLIHADNPESAKHGVWVNPSVRVAYKVPAYLKVKQWPKLRDRLTYVLWNFANDLFGLPWPKPVIETAVKKWLDNDPSRKDREPGLFCLEDQMQVLTSRGWKTVKRKQLRNEVRLQWKQDPWLE